MATANSINAVPTRARTGDASIDYVDLEELARELRKALAIAMYISEADEEHASPAAAAIVDRLQNACSIVQGKEAEVRHG